MGIEHFSLKNIVRIFRSVLDVRSGLIRIELPFSRLLSLLVCELVGFLIVAAFAFGACLGALYFGKSLWFVYSQTLIGQEFLRSIAEGSQAVDKFYNRHLMLVCTEMNVAVITYSIPLAVVCQCTYLKAILYDSKGIIGKTVFWVLPFSAVISYVLASSYLYELHWTRLVLFVILPSALLLNHFMECAARIIPHGLLLNAIYAVICRIGYFASKILLFGKKEE